MILVVTTILLGVAFYIYNTYISPRINPDFVANREFDQKDEGYADIYLFAVDWCPYSKKAKPILSKKRTRANAPSTRSINIKGVEKQNIAKSPTKKKQPAKAPADDVSLAPVSHAEKEERPAKATKNDAKRVKVDEEISFISPKVSKTSVEKPTSGAKKGKSSKVEEQVEGASPVMKLLQAAGRRLGILKK